MKAVSEPNTAAEISGYCSANLQVGILVSSMPPEDGRYTNQIQVLLLN
jgi:hypothetical protein